MDTVCVTRRGSQQSFTVFDVKSAFQIRLLSTIKEWAQYDVKSYWQETSTCPFDMPLGRENFCKLNAHIDGSTATAHVSKVIGDVERYNLCF